MHTQIHTRADGEVIEEGWWFWVCQQMPLASPPSFSGPPVYGCGCLMSLCMFGCKAHECWHVQVCGPLCWRGSHCVHFINGECVREHGSVAECGVAMPPCLLKHGERVPSAPRCDHTPGHLLWD